MTPIITASQLDTYAAAFEQAGVARQAAARTLSAALERLAALPVSTASIAAVNWTYADLQTAISNDPMGTLRRLLAALRELGANRDNVAAELFGADLAGPMTQLGTVFALSDLVTSDALAVG
jgi:hypothetical protein